jgi:hypothetical protein
MAALKLNLRCRGLGQTEVTPRLRENYVIAPVLNEILQQPTLRIEVRKLRLHRRVPASRG